MKILEMYMKDLFLAPASSSNASHRKNHPLCAETIRWKSDVPLTEGQLRSKRDEFWDTAPAFDGRAEIWQALKAASAAAEALDFQLSQAILDGANISVPHGDFKNNFIAFYFHFSFILSYKNCYFL